MKRISSIILSVSIAFSAIFFVRANTFGATLQTPITRGEVENRALKMINLQWSYDASKNSNIVARFSGMVALPKQFDNVTNGNFTGIPYNWGGLDSIDSKSYNAPWTNFTDAINNGAYAGNIKTSSAYGYIAGTAGIDCSGFIQAAFNIKDYKISTSTIFNNYFKKISISEIKHMDILNKASSHVIIFDRWGVMGGVQGAYTYEATTDQYYGGIQGTKKYFKPMSVLNNGYVAGRYINIVEDTPTKVVPPTNTLPFTGKFAKITDIIGSASLRLTPSYTGTLLEKIPKDSIVYLNNFADGWYKVKYGQRLGWVSKNQISAIESGKYVTLKATTYQLSIRTSTLSTAKVAAKLYKDMYAKVSDYSKDGSWLKVEINGVSGWTQSKYLNYIY